MSTLTPLCAIDPVFEEIGAWADEWVDDTRDVVSTAQVFLWASEFVHTMGVRPPADDTDDEPAVIEFGIAALDATLSDAGIEYPTDVETLRSEIGHRQVPFNATGQTVTVEEALEQVPRQRFETEQELLNTLHPVFEARREATSNSLLSQLRALVPF